VIPARAQTLIVSTRPLADLFAAAGHRLYLVGGIVRDTILGRALDGSDLDLTTDATPTETLELIRGWADSIWTQGQRFGTIGAIHGDERYEITTHRAESYQPGSRKPEVTFSHDVETDLSRRDFTINAMALEVTGGSPTLIDPFDGVGDLARRQLRTPLTPEISFEDDPLRMLRAARFIAGLGLEPAPGLVDATTRTAARLEIVSAERVRDELDKLMVVADPTAGLWFVHDTGVSEHFLPELGAMRLEQDPIHRHKDVLAHTIAVVSNTSPELKVRLAALFHDVGKPRTREVGGANGVSFHHHEVVGARMTRARMTALKYPKDLIDDVTRLVYLHLRFHTYGMGWTDSAVRRFVRDAGDLLDELIELTRCDCTTRNRRKAEMLSRRMDDLEHRIAEVGAAEELKAMRPEIDGQAVMDRLGIGPGRDVGEAMRFLLELRLEEGEIGVAEVNRRLDEWWVARR